MSESTPETNVEIVVGSPSRGKFPVTLMLEGNVLFAGRVDPHDPEKIETFVAAAQEKFAALDPDALRDQILQLAAPLTNSSTEDTESSTGECPYIETDQGLVHRKVNKNGEVYEEPLTNFLARIVTDTSRDDGVERQHVFEMEANVAGATRRFSIPAAQFAPMAWVIEHLGASAILHPGNARKDHARAAIQFLSANHETRTIFAHAGWRKYEEQWVYLHNGGAIGASGVVEGPEVDLPEALAGYELPAPVGGTALVEAVNASLRLLELAPDHITFPLVASLFRSTLGSCDFVIHATGPSGVFKSELMSLLQQHFGPKMDARHLPANWTSTDNSIEGLAFSAKDAVMVIDDYAPGGTQIDVQKLRQKADRVIRGAGNHAGRGRMRPDGTLRANRPPRCLIMSTGEDVPAGYSLRARMLVLEIGPGEIDREKLTACQADGRTGAYASTMSEFVRWLAARLDQVQAAIPAKLLEYRHRAAASSQHARTPDMVAQIAVGMLYFLRFAVATRTIDKAQAHLLFDRFWMAIGHSAQKQIVHQRAMEPAQRFLELLSSAFTTGSAHLVRASGRPVPPTPSAWGWRHRTVGSGDAAVNDWHPQGQRIGWLEGEQIYLDPDAAYRAAQAMAAGGDGVSITPQTLWKRLDEKGLLIREDGRDELKIRRVLDGVTRRIVCLHRSSLLVAVAPPHPANSPFPPPEEQDDGGNGGNGGSGSVVNPLDPEDDAPASAFVSVGLNAGSGNGTAP